jgi:hypothetical protein
MESYSSQATLRDRFATMILGSQPKVSTPTGDPAKKPPAKKAVPAKP